MRSVIDILSERSAARPDRRACAFLEDGEREGASLTYADLDWRARTLAVRLRRLGCEGAPVLLLCPDGVEYVAGFFACLYARAIAVPAHPPRHARRMDRLEAIVADAQPRAVLATRAVAQSLRDTSLHGETPHGEAFPRQAEATWRALPWILLDGDAVEDLSEEWRRPDVAPDTAAFLQYTSGSTAAPKGVIVSHGSLMHNQRAIATAFRHHGTTVGWLPLQHDMGLIGNVLHSIHAGTPLYLMSPAAFLQRPARWLHAIARYRATTSGAPNFAYELCARAVGEADKSVLDLSSWTLAFCGAEPIRPDTLARFARAFAPCGFRPTALSPCYGLAEATLLVAGGRTSAGPRVERFDRAALDAHRVERRESGEEAHTGSVGDARKTDAATMTGTHEASRTRTLVSCGRPFLDQRIAIVDPVSRTVCAPAAVGEIWVSGPSVALGYWRKPTETEAVFGAHTADGDGPFLRTGDLGFLYDGELFVTGRLKEMIIIRGRKHQAEDVEHTASRAHDALLPDGAAAFARDLEGEERLAIVLELAHRQARTGMASATAPDPSFAEVVASVRQAVADRHEVAPAFVCLIPKGALPRTSSGKVQRSACRDQFASGRLSIAYEWQASRRSSIVAPLDIDLVSALRFPDTTAPAEPGTSNEASPSVVESGGGDDWLRHAVATRLGIASDALALHEPLTAHGLDSVTAVQLAHDIARRTGRAVSVTALLDGVTLADLVARTAAADATHGTVSEAASVVSATATEQSGPPGNPAFASSAPALAAPGDRALTLGQHAMLFADELGAGRPVYHLARAWRLGSTVDDEALVRALAALMARHAALRTTHPRTAGLPGLRVHAQLPVPFEHLDDSASDEPIQRVLERHAGAPFDLEHAPPWRVRLVTRGRESTLLFVFHHVAADLWSVGVLARELLARYGEYAARGTTLSGTTLSGAPLSGAPLPGTALSGTALSGTLRSGKPRSGTTPHAFGAIGDDLDRLDLARLERQTLAAEGARLEAFWSRVLRAPLPALALPARPRPETRRFEGRTCTGRAPVPVVARLKDAAARERTTLYTVLLTAFQGLLQRITGQQDFLVGTPANRRQDARLREVVGYLVNPLVIRADLRDDPTWRALLQRTRVAVLEALAHEDYPFPLLVDRFAPTRDGRRQPLIDAMFVMQQVPDDVPAGLMATVLNQPHAPVDVHGLHLACVPTDLRVAAFDLTLTVGELDDELIVSLQYDADLFDAAMAESWLSQYVDLLAALPAELDRPASARSTSIASPDAATATSIDALFRAQAEQRPQAVAISDGGRQVTYSELDAWSSRLAETLQALGVTTETLVTLFLDRSADLIAAMIGVLKAGGAYVPIDPRYPAERVRFILRDTRSPVVIAHRRTAATLPPGEATVVWVDELEGVDELVGVDEPTRAASSSGEPPRPVTTRDDRHADDSRDRLAYVIYTSGSTGQPKGVLVTHHNVLRLFSSSASWFGFTHDDTWTLFHSPAFDFSVWEIWGALLHGGRLAIVPYDVSRSPEELHDLLTRERVTVLNQTPSAFRLLSEVDASRDRSALASLRFVIFGGEALDLGTLATWVARHGDETPRLINMYGITETTVHVTYRRVRAGDVHHPSGSVVGEALPDLVLRVLDADLGEAAAGAPGELFVGGAGVARGYLNRPDLTAERFLPDPQSREPGARLYRSGDRGRRIGERDLEYLGRVDAQVKIRGHRIEPAEIEAALRRHRTIADAVVVARGSTGRRGAAYQVEDEEPGRLTPHRAFLKGRGQPEEQADDRHLVAYIVPHPDAAVVPGEIRQFLATWLPEVMIPAAFVAMEALPLTPHGKVDRRALPPPFASAISARSHDGAPAAAAPRTAVEVRLAAVWTEVLGVAPIGIHDNFFDLGGDSIRSLQIRAKAAERGLSFTLQQLLQHPTIAALASVLDADPAVSEAVARTRAFGLIDEDDRARLPVDVVDAYPLSRIQAGMFYHMQLAPDTGIYHDLFFYALRARFDADCLRTAIQAALDRHPILRSSFDFGRFSEPLQLVHAHVPASLEVIDWRMHSPTARERARQDWIAEELRRPADPATASQIRFIAQRVADDGFDLVLSFYDVIFDGWSTSTVLAEILTAYAALIDGRPLPVLPAPAVTYRDFVALERATVGDRQAVDFWRDELSRLAVVPLPRWGELSGPPQIRALDVPIDEALSDALARAARHVGVPLKHVLLAVHLRVLSTLTGRAVVSTGLESNGRLETLDGDRVVGIHINTVPLTQRLAPGTWASLVRQTYEEEMRLLPFRRYPLFDLYKQGGRRELVESVFNYTHFHLLRSMAGLDAIGIRGAWGYEHTNFPLRAEFNRNPFTDRLQLDLVVNLAEIGEAQAREIGAIYLNALRTIAADPESRHDAASLLPPARWRQVVREWNATETPRRQDERLHDLVVDQVQRTPDAEAVVFGTQRLSYAELDRHASDLAARLHTHGVGPDVLVGVLMERSIELVVALLGVSKAGGAFLPLDPAAPPERLRIMLEDAGPRVLLLDRARVGDPLVREARCPTLCLDLAREAARPPQGAVPAAGRTRRDRTAGAHLAYVLYTSGSTGRPKAVMNTHAGIVNRLRWMQEQHPLTAADRVLQKTPIGFDVAIPEFFAPLMAGACLVVARPGGHKDPAYLAETIRTERITAVHFVPSMLQAFLDQPGLDEGCRTLARVTCSGEALSLALQQQTFARLAVELYNLYGPTEAAVEVSAWHCDPAQDRGRVPIGRPISRTQLYVLDEQMAPVSVGTVGELYIGGASLARGYLGRPDGTADRFVPDPFDRRGGGRLYRTGDLVRYRPDGAIEFLGRRDQQIKIRGVRVELGEIDAALSAHPAVRAAVVAPIDDEGRAGLIAYVVAAEMDGDRQGVERTLRDFLRRRLPDAMVPGRFVWLDALPLTPSGKVDRRALPPPGRTPSVDAHAPDGRDVTETVRTPIEEILAGLWAQCLRLDRVDPHASFFDLGGDSLTVTQLASRIRETFGIELSLQALFEHSTVAGLAPRIEAALDRQRPVLPSLARIAERPAHVPLSFAQERLYFLAETEPSSRAYSNPAVLTLAGPLDVEALQATLTALVARHESLRTTFASIDGTPVQVIGAPWTVDLPLDDLRGRPADDQWSAIREALQQQSAQAFDLARGPLVRVGLFRVADDVHVLLLTIHHIASDGWSMGLLVQEAAHLYGALAAGRPPALADLPLQYADFAIWQRRELTGPALDDLRQAWATALRGLPAGELPTDRPRPDVLTHRGGRVRATVSQATATRLHALGRRAGATLFMTTMAAFGVVVHAETGDEDLVIGTDVANRTRAETEGLVGFFVNQLVLRLDLSGAPTFDALLRRVRRTALDAYALQDLPFEQVVDVVNPRRAANRTPLFQVKFVMQNAPMPRLEVGDVRIEIADLHAGTAKFDLLVDAWETTDGLALSFEYREELFEPRTIARLSDNYVTVLDAIAANPHASVPALVDAIRRHEGGRLREQEQHRRTSQRTALGRLARRHPDEPGAPAGQEAL